MTLRRFVASGLALVLGLVFSSGLALAQAKAPQAKLNLNAASAAQLESLPGVGPKLAARIVAYRQKSGRAVILPPKMIWGPPQADKFSRKSRKLPPKGKTPPAR